MEENRFDREDLTAALKTLEAGGILLYPTDTVWGLGCDATNPDAVTKLFALKKRADSKAMLSLVESEGGLERWVSDIPDIAFQLLEAALDPLTIIYDHPHGIAPGLIAEDGSAAFRITSERFSSELCRRFRRPVVSTSANISGKPSPRFFDEITDDIKNAVDYVVKYGRNMPPSRPSNIIKISDGGVVKVIR